MTANRNVQGLLQLMTKNHSSPTTHQRTIHVLRTKISKIRIYHNCKVYCIEIFIRDVWSNEHATKVYLLSIHTHDDLAKRKITLTFFLTIAIVNGNWALWGSWTSCSVTCGSGTQSRTRTCTDPAPANGGSTCSGNSTASQACNTQNCPSK